MFRKNVGKESLTVEDCLELVAGISQLKFHDDPTLSKLQNFKLHEDNHKIMFSIAKQVFKGTALTQRQYTLVQKLLVDAATTIMVSKPEKLDVIVATNLHADILSDLASAITGSIGIGATANIATKKGIPSMFEPIHGSAFDIVGKNIANPIGAIWSASLMLENLGEKKSANKIMNVIELYAKKNGPFTPDLNGSATTSEVINELMKIIKTEYN